MVHATTSTPGRVRVTVTSGTRRVDLALPGGVPVAELLPELAGTVGLLDADTVHGGHRLVSAAGRELVAEVGLVGQGVEDGAVLTVAAGLDGAPPRAHDDVVEAVAEAVEHDLGPWRPVAGRRTALAAAWLLLAHAALGLLLQGGARAGLAAALVSLGVLGGAVVLSRTQDEPVVAVATAWLGAFFAAVAGLLLAADGPLPGVPVAAAGGGAALAGLVAMPGLRAGRVLVLPPVVVGTVFLAAGPVVRLAAVDVAVVLTVVLVLVVVAGGAAPWLAIAATGSGLDPDDVDRLAVGVAVRRAHEVLLALSSTVGLTLVLLAPYAVSRGLAGALVAATCCLVVVLRVRHHRAGAAVMVGLVSGVAGLASVAVSSVWLHPGWRPATALLLALAGAVVLVLTVLPPRPSVRRARLGDLAETSGLVCLPPLLVVATGLFAAIRG